MNKNKKIFFICFLSFSLSFALASCESDEKNQSSSSDSKETDKETNQETNKETNVALNWPVGAYGASPSLTVGGKSLSIVLAPSGGHGPLEYKSETPSVCSADSQGEITAVSAGSCRVQARFSGNEEYSPSDWATLAIQRKERVLFLSYGFGDTCAVLNNGKLKCWGYNDNGELGLGDTEDRGDGTGEMGDDLAAVDLGGRTATTIATGGLHACALLDDSSVKCWGRNYYGQLGLGDEEHRGDGADEMGDDLPAVDLGTGRTATAIAAGYRHTCALLDDSSVKCWGGNDYGQLGLGNKEYRVGDGADEMGDDLAAVNLGTGRTATAIAAGGYHTCALLDDKSVKCWGHNSSGQLGLGDEEHRGDGTGEMGDDLAAVDLGTGRTATAIAMGRDHTCALLDDSSVKCWGHNSSGQLGLGDKEHRGDGTGEMGDDLAAVDLGTGRTATAIEAGYRHTCALLDDRSVKCWGQNSSGGLGLGNRKHKGDGADEMGDNLPAVDLGTGRTATAIAAGYRHTCALLDDSSVKCWGHNSSGQLGLGDTEDRGDGADEMGDNLPVVDLGEVVSVSKGSQSLEWPDDTYGTSPSLTVGDSLDIVNEPREGQGSIEYRSLVESICTVGKSSGSITGVAAGDCVLQARYAGNSNYYRSTWVRYEAVTVTAN